MGASVLNQMIALSSQLTGDEMAILIAYLQEQRNNAPATRELLTAN